MSVLAACCTTPSRQYPTWSRSASASIRPSPASRRSTACHSHSPPPFPSYQFAFADKLTGDPSGQTIPVNGLGILKIVFTRAQAHASGEARSTIVSQPARNVGFQRIVDYAQSGDFEGVLSYGVGVTYPVVRSNPQILVRAYEVETVAPNGQYLYVVAIDIDTANHG